jgi:NodT family efflux transporter outer membrane factor (OMF) lipoprotein
MNLAAFALMTIASLSACTVGPDYVRPTLDTPAAFKESNGWKSAQPRDQEIRGKWWEAFNDPVLNSLEEQVDISNQNLAQAEARFRQAATLIQSSRAALFPSVAGSASASRSSSAASRNASLNGGTDPNNSFSVALGANWEPDLWGRVRRTVESSEAGAQASAADLEAARLSMHAQLAQTYFLLRALDVERQLLERTLGDYQKSLQLTENQYAAGVTAKANVILAQTQLKSTQAQALEVGIQRAQTEHAIATLVGKPASSFSLAPAPLVATIPALPPGLPSTLLERRPDVAAAERRVAVANAQIGVAQSAFFPSLTLSAAFGVQNSNLSNLLSLPNRYWSFGPALAQSLFDAGARKAQSEQAIAAYDGTVANYRQTVLTGFQEVEDNLVTLRVLEKEAQVQNEALQLARQSVAIATNQYKAGTVNYLNVVNAQVTALNSERNAVDIFNRRLAASALLIRSLGGGWDPALLSNLEAVTRKN